MLIIYLFYDSDANFLFGWYSWMNELVVKNGIGTNAANLAFFGSTLYKSGAFSLQFRVGALARVRCCLRTRASLV